MRLSNYFKRRIYSGLRLVTSVLISAVVCLCWWFHLVKQVLEYCVVNFAERAYYETYLISIYRIINITNSVFKSKIQFSNREYSFQITNTVFKSQIKYKSVLFSNHVRKNCLWRTPRYIHNHIYKTMQWMSQLI